MKLNVTDKGIIRTSFNASTGMWSSSFYLGTFVGPTLGGVLVDACGFPWTTVIFFGFYCVTILLDMCQFIYEMKLQKHIM